MSSRLDELFSPDRLRQNWQKPLAPTPELIQNTPILAIHSQYQELQQLITERFSDASRLSVKFAELTEQINSVFPLNEPTVTADAKQKQAIVNLLEELEELIWAMDLSLRQNNR